MSLIESLRKRHQEHQPQRPHDKPMKKRERAPFAYNLLNEIDALVDATPEFQKSSIERRFENRATRLINRKPIEYTNSQGHFAISKGKWKEKIGSTLRAVQIKFTPTNSEGMNEKEALTIEVYHRELPPHNPGVSNEVYIWAPYNIGNFSLKGYIPNSGDKKLVPNSQETLDAIKSLLPVLFPSPNRSRIVYKPNLNGFFPEQK